MKRTRLLHILLCLCLVLTLCGCGTKEVRKQIFAMDTFMDLTAYGDNAEAALTDVILNINHYSTALDPEVDGSMVSAMNAAAGEPVTADPLILEMLTTAQTVWQRTDGALDLTVYPIVKAWGFIDSAHTVPDEAAIDALTAVPCFDRVTISGDTVTLPPEAEISFGAVAKGAMAEQCRDILRSHGVESAFLSLGGNVQTIGTKPDGSLWRIGVQDPANLSGHLGIVSIGEAALVTSGSYQRYFEQDGVVYHHIIDPATARPADSGLVSATIICDSGTMADALSTSMFILGEDAALAYQRTYGGFAMILVTEDDRVIVSGDVEFEETNDRYQYEYIQ